MNTRATPTGTDSTSHRLLLLAIAAGTALAPLNSTMIAVALPDIQRGYDASVTATTWLVTIYLIAMASGLPIGGRLGDAWGWRRMYLVGLAAFAVASLGCAFAPDLPWLVAFRVLQALAAALLLPNASALVRESIPAVKRGMAFGMIGLAVAAGAGFGPPIGGLLVETFGWASIFWVNIPLTGALFPIALRSLPRRVGTPPAREPFDFLGVALLTGTLSAVMLIPTLVTLGQGALALIGVVAGIALGWAFARWERRTPSPVVDPDLFTSRHFAAACATILTSNVVMYATLLAIPLYLEQVHGESATTTGMMLGAMSVLAAFATPLGGRWADRQGRWLPAVTGTTVLCGGTALVVVALTAENTSLLVGALAVLGLGLGISGAPVQAAAVESVAAERAGSASGVYSTSRYVGNLIGASTLALLFASDPAPGDSGWFVALFAALVIVAGCAILASSRIAGRSDRVLDHAPVAAKQQ